MVTESERLALMVLKERFDRDPNIYYPAKDVGEDPLFLERSTNTFRPISSAGLVLGNLQRKSLVDIILLVDDIQSPIRLYRISSQGVCELERINESVRLMREQLEKELQTAIEKASACLENLKKFQATQRVLV